ncbi:MAG: hypothetical protein HUK08_08415 [Bacteroidaceae bacterium]|nr:hypothetical protein [Bacteroidaceae bacterium]
METIKKDKISFDLLRRIDKGETNLFELPNRRACENGKSMGYIFALKQEPKWRFSFQVVKDNFLLVHRIK